MPLVDLVDATFVVADPRTVAAIVADPDRWTTWWPDLELRVERDRGVKGMQWVARTVSTRARPLVGTLEIWLEPWDDGVVVHHFARLDPQGWREGEAQQRRWADRERARLARRWKGHVHALKDSLEHGRAPGEPRQPEPRELDTSFKEAPAPADDTPDE